MKFVGAIWKPLAPAPISAKRPTVMPQMMVAFEPIEAPRRMRVGTTDQSLSDCREPSRLTGSRSKQAGLVSTPEAM